MTLTDTDPMPFGQKYKGTRMQDVPADYYYWMWHEAGFKNKVQDPVHKYIKDNMDVLKSENEDLIWD